MLETSGSHSCGWVVGLGGGVEVTMGILSIVQCCLPLPLLGSDYSFCFTIKNSY